MNATTDLTALCAGLAGPRPLSHRPRPFCGARIASPSSAPTPATCGFAGSGVATAGTTIRWLPDAGGGKSFREATQDTRYEIRDTSSERRSSPVPRVPFCLCPGRGTADQPAVVAQKRAVATVADGRRAATRRRSRGWCGTICGPTGLSPDTIRCYMLGYVPEGRNWRRLGLPARHPHPGMVDGQLWYVKARLPRAGGRRPPATAGGCPST